MVVTCLFLRSNIPVVDSFSTIVYTTQGRGTRHNVDQSFLNKQQFPTQKTELWMAPSDQNVGASTTSNFMSERKTARANLLRPFKMVLWPFVRLITFVQRFVFRVTVRAVAGFMTAVLIDPGVNKAAASAIKDGINLWFTQRNVKEKLAALQQNLSEQDPALAKDIGKDFPKVLFDFIVGVVLQGYDEQVSGKDASKDIDEAVQ